MSLVVIVMSGWWVVVDISMVVSVLMSCGLC